MILSLFPGIGLLDRAFEEEGFCVVRGPDLLWGGDIRRFHPPEGKFAGVIGGPPCQAFSRLANLVRHNGFTLAPNLIPEFERCIDETNPHWFLMENVPEAPEPQVRWWPMKSILLNNRWCGGEQNRVRRFSFGHRSRFVVERFYVPGEALEPIDKTPAVTANGTRWVPVKIGGTGKVKRTHRPAADRSAADRSAAYFHEAIRAQGLPDDFDLPGFTVAGKIRALGNGVPLPLGRAVARAVKAALGDAHRSVG